MKKEQVLNAIDREISDAKELEYEGDRGLFISKLENLRDYVNSAKTDEDMNKVMKNNMIQDIFHDRNFKRPF